MINKLFIDFIVLPNLIVRLNDPQPPYPVSSLPGTGLLVCVCTLPHTQKAARQVSPVCCDSCSVIRTLACSLVITEAQLCLLQACRRGLQLAGRKLPSMLSMVRGGAYQPQDPDL